MTFAPRPFLLALVILLPVMGCKRTSSLSLGGPAAGRGDLSELSTADQHLEQKIQPVIGCLNRTFSHFENMAPSYHKKIKNLVSPPPPPPPGSFAIPDISSFDSVFVSFKIEPFEQNGQFYKECEEGLDKAVAQSPSDPNIDAPARDAAQALRALQDPGAQMDAYLDQKGFLDDHAAKARQLDATISPLLNRLVDDSQHLRTAVFQTKGVLVQHELDLIEKKSGRNLDWHTRQTMQVASIANRQVQEAASSGKLNAAGVDQAMQPLKSSLDDTQAYLARNPGAASAPINGVDPVWPSISASLSSELGDLRSLRTTLAAMRNPSENDRSQVNSDLDNVNRSFNGAVQSYNQMRGLTVHN